MARLGSPPPVWLQARASALSMDSDLFRSIPNGPWSKRSNRAISAVRAATRGSSRRAAPALLRAHAASTASSGKRLCAAPSPTAPTEDPRPYLRTMALRDPELAAGLAAHLRAKVAAACDGVDLVCGPLASGAHVSVGEGAEIRVSGAELRFASWLPVFLDEVVLRIGTLGGPPPERVIEGLPSLLDGRGAVFGPDAFPQTDHVLARDAQGDGPLVDPEVEGLPVREAITAELSAVHCHDEEGWAKLLAQSGDDERVHGFDHRIFTPPETGAQWAEARTEGR